MNSRGCKRCLFLILLSFLTQFLSSKAEDVIPNIIFWGVAYMCLCFTKYGILLFITEIEFFWALGIQVWATSPTNSIEFDLKLAPSLN